ncbi:MAG: hypothetical protein HWD60_00740 [Defluviicoccus sp.]|nr:MAG: hypothetical protein HWD60_00740 [Defluviicoccus sp.]
MTSTATGLHNFENAPDAFDAALGKLTRRFGQVEHLLATIIHRTTGDDWSDVLARLGSDLRDRGNLLKEVRRCYVEWVAKTFNETVSGERISDFDRIRNNLRDALVQRDQFTHCAWGYDASGNFRATRRGKPLIIGQHPADDSDIERVSENLWKFFMVLNVISRQSSNETNEKASYIIQNNLACEATGASYWGEEKN